MGVLSSGDVCRRRSAGLPPRTERGMVAGTAGHAARGVGGGGEACHRWHTPAPAHPPDGRPGIARAQLLLLLPMRCAGDCIPGSAISDTTGRHDGVCTFS